MWTRAREICLEKMMQQPNATTTTATSTTSIDSTLEERGKRYGKFTDHAAYTQNIKNVIRNSPNWDRMRADQREALEMIAHKIGRMLSGDPNYRDNWHDIVGYAKLVDDRMKEDGLS